MVSIYFLHLHNNRLYIYTHRLFLLHYYGKLYISLLFYHYMLSMIYHKAYNLQLYHHKNRYHINIYHFLMLNFLYKLCIFLMIHTMNILDHKCDIFPNLLFQKFLLYKHIIHFYLLILLILYLFQYYKIHNHLFLNRRMFHKNNGNRKYFFFYVMLISIYLLLNLVHILFLIFFYRNGTCYSFHVHFITILIMILNYQLISLHDDILIQLFYLLHQCLYL